MYSNKLLYMQNFFRCKIFVYLVEDNYIVQLNKIVNFRRKFNNQNKFVCRYFQFSLKNLFAEFWCLCLFRYPWTKQIWVWRACDLSYLVWPNRLKILIFNDVIVLIEVVLFRQGENFFLPSSPINEWMFDSSSEVFNTGGIYIYKFRIGYSFTLQHIMATSRAALTLAIIELRAFVFFLRRTLLFNCIVFCGFTNLQMWQ